MERLVPPPNVLDIARRLEAAGFEAWCVGGAIRDALLGERHLDWDLATSAHPSDVRRIFGARSTIPVGIEFGTVGVLDRDGTMHEVTTFRRDVLTDGRHAKVEFGGSLDDDLARRDLTINAIAYSPTRHELRDPFGGRGDLERQLIRAVGDPDERMREDRLRALRAIRFSARFGFVLEPRTRAAIERSAPFLGRLSAERVKQELDKTMEQVRRPSTALRTWRDTGAFATLIPALAAASDAALAVPDFLAQPGIPRRPARRTERFAGLLVSLSARDAGAVLTGLRASKQEIQQVTALVERYHTVGGEMAACLGAGATPSDYDVRRWVARIGRLNVPSLTRLLAAVWSADGAAGPSDAPAPAAAAVRRLYRRLLRSAYNDTVDLGGLAVDGDDLRRAGIPAGPRMGGVLQSLLDAVIADPSRNTTDWLLQEARRLHQTSGD
jgi:tRNA nucleotidyltransferase (CCA-adding enzyme)